MEKENKLTEQEEHGQYVAEALTTSHYDTTQRIEDKCDSIFKRLTTEKAVTINPVRVAALTLIGAIVLSAAAGAGGGLYVYKRGPSFLGLVPEHYGEHSYGKLLDICMAVEKENAVLKGRGSFADAIFNDTYSEYLHDHPYSEFSAHQQRRVFELAFEAGLVNVLNWIADSPEAMNGSRREILHERIDELNRGGDVPFARHDAMYYRQKYYDLKRHHESDLHPEINEDVVGDLVPLPAD